MNTLMDKTAILDRMRAQVAAGSPIIGAGAGIGLSAKWAAARGAGQVIGFNAGK
ncbi:phosphoenolpyruvate hydrolase family protein [Phytohabitans sp. ZYX-F-186]|uniref:Phosphoenolpyruvate hydrolase family protein n=1 Tax=Phytohabitans maris TaxID=3071409 RepID=A0ABU0ZKG6_9ACTN|nr:phosphoenolpyruvate hydrolase family protein [Phytohabitans sp. ZYX-F-186]MDQ7907544.1 phosphoenolpyruvate hydrolase family protein [Phytohabitans sp. ZYX-F-186]